MRATREAGLEALIGYAIANDVPDMAVLRGTLGESQRRDVSAFLASGQP